MTLSAGAGRATVGLREPADAAALVVGALLHRALRGARADVGWAWRIGVHAITPALGAGSTLHRRRVAGPRCDLGGAGGV